MDADCDWRADSGVARRGGSNAGLSNDLAVGDGAEEPRVAPSV
jgi:hypothetical protein